MKRCFLPFAGAIGLVLWSGCGRHGPAGAASSPLPPVPVRTVVLRLETSPAFTALAGTVQPVERAVIAAKVMGTIEDFSVALGQVVSAGQSLGRISAPELSARLQQAQAQLRQAERDLARERELVDKQASPAELVKSLEDRVALTRGQVREAEALLEHTVIRAPFAGVVVDRPAHAGDLAMPGLPLVSIEGRDRFQVELSVPSGLAGAIAPGTELTVHVPGTDLRVTGRLGEISPAADPHTRTVRAKLDLPGAALRSGQFVRVSWPSGEFQALLAPRSAISLSGQMERVFVVTSGRAQLRLVRTGPVRGDRVQLQAGVEPGETLVLAPPAALRDGSPVEVIP